MNKIKTNIIDYTTNSNEVVKDYFTIIPGESNVMISAPHTFSHIRLGKRKPKDAGTLTIANLLKQLSNIHLIYANKDLNFDPNFNAYNIYQRELIKYIKDNKIEYLIDLHGSKTIRNFDIEIGTNNYKNVNDDKKLVKDIVKILKKYEYKKIVLDKRFKSSTNTICKIINNETNIKTLQLEINRKYRNPVKNKIRHITLIESLLNTISYLERRNKMEDINYEEKYDAILDIKPSYGYKRELKKIEYNQVGLEIEVSVNFERNSYSFIRKLLIKIKELIGDNGYFVKDGTIIGDYSFEIVLDPMKVEDINKIYTQLLEIIEFSCGSIEISKEKKCGIHLNFNKYDVADLSEAHKKVTTFVSENRKYFDENMYKQYKFIWDYDKYTKYQKEIGDKYLWINYLKNKVIEVRNIKAGISPKDLSIIISNILESLYPDKELKTNDYSTFVNLDKIYNTAFDKNTNDDIYRNIKDNEFVVISVKDSTGKIVKLPEELSEQIKKIL